jgi:hypothetical protein
MERSANLTDRAAANAPVPDPATAQANASRVARGITRRRAGLLLASLAASSFAGWTILQAGPFSGRPVFGSNRSITPEAGRTLFDEAAASVLPTTGFRSRIALQDSVLKLVAEGVIDAERFASVYESRGGLPVELSYILIWPSHLPIHLTGENAGYYVNLLWPVGLANYMSTNKTSPVNGGSLFNFASTAGWTLGNEENGGAYFNRFRIVDLTPEQEALVTRVAKSTFRPCCNNSTFFQDCNHGSALLGLLQLGASQGLTEDELYGEALAFNALWFPQVYVQTALYFKVVEGVDWADVDPRTVMGARYSALGPWQATVGAQLARIPNLLPQQEDSASCGA